MFSGQRQPYPSEDERERVARARQAAEALFAAKPAMTDRAAVPTAAPRESVRKPRVLAIVRPVPAHHEPPAPPRRQPRAPRTRHPVPRSQYARIRTWVEYGMTAAEVAEVYGAAIGEIERILRKA